MVVNYPRRGERAIARISKTPMTCANGIIKKENDALEAVPKSGKNEIISLTSAEGTAMEKGLVSAHDENVPRIGRHTIDKISMGTRLRR